MPCKIKCVRFKRTCRKSNTHRSKYACIVEANESTRKHSERTQHKCHEDHIARMGHNSLSHYNLVHKFIPMPQAMKIPEAWQLTKVRRKKEIHQEARTERKTVHFATLMDICHLENAVLESQFQKYIGRVVLRGDIVKDSSGSSTAFTEQGSSASQMTAAKVMNVIARPPGCAGQAADAVSAYTQVKMEHAPVLLKTPKNKMAQTSGYVYHDTIGRTLGPVWKTQSLLLNEICMVIHFQHY